MCAVRINCYDSPGQFPAEILVEEELHAAEPDTRRSRAAAKATSLQRAGVGDEDDRRVETPAGIESFNERAADPQN